MKKKLHILTALSLCTALLLAPVHAFAASGRTQLDQYQRKAPELTVETEDFLYSYYPEEITWVNGTRYEYLGREIEEGDEVWHQTVMRRTFTVNNTDANYMVTGVFYVDDGYGIPEYPLYTLLPINSSTKPLEPCNIYGDWLEPYLGKEPLAVGDMLYADKAFSILESNPAQYMPYDTTSIVKTGNALELFGDAFRPVAQQELFLAPNYAENMEYFTGKLYQPDTADIVALKGDVLQDENVGVLDIVALNQCLLGTRSLNSIQSVLAADMNDDTEVDVFDLALLKREVLTS